MGAVGSTLFVVCPAAQYPRVSVDASRCRKAVVERPEVELPMLRRREGGAKGCSQCSVGCAMLSRGGAVPNCVESDLRILRSSMHVGEPRHLMGRPGGQGAPKRERRGLRPVENG